MSALENLFEKKQYSLAPAEKTDLLFDELRGLNAQHYANCEPFARLCKNIFSLSAAEPITKAAQPIAKTAQPIAKIEDLPFVPAALFKGQRLQSIPDSEVLRIMHSSGTSAQQPSQIVLDKETALLQTKALAAIITSLLGPKRLPMIIIDSKSVLRDPRAMTARGAGILGFANFGRDHLYALDDDMRLDDTSLRDFLKKHRGERILLFGFTFMVWQYFCQALSTSNNDIDLSNAVLLHGGGWKKLSEQAVSNQDFKKRLLSQFNLQAVHNFYGMVEQTGSIYLECEAGYLHAPNFSEVIVRDFLDWKPLPVGKKGVIQTLSVLPRSYPGHSLLTEDLGELAGLDGCVCGRRGTHFTVLGRVPQAELRGCSDTHQTVA